MRHFIAITALLATALSFTSAVQAQEYRWVSDVIYVPMRSGKGNQYRILDSAVRTGTRLKLISEDKEAGWVEVENAKGQVGFIPIQYVIDRPTAAIQLEATSKKLQDLQTKYNELRNELRNTDSTRADLHDQLQSVTAENQKLATELDTIRRVSADALSLNKRHQQLMKDHQIMQTEMDVLKADNERLRKEDRNTFFLYGALAVLLGVIIAIVAPLLRRRKRFSEWA